MMGKVKHMLDDGIGFAVLDRLPLDSLSVDEAKSVYWVLGQLLSSPVATKWDGTMLYDVTDTGAAHEYGVRGADTNVELVFHNDNGYGTAVPDYVSLMCLRAGPIRGRDPAVQPVHRAQRTAQRRSGFADASLRGVLLRPSS